LLHQGRKLLSHHVRKFVRNLWNIKEADGVKKEVYPSRRLMRSSTKAIIYDMTDKGNVKLIREVELEGSYVSSRKIGTSLYLVANDYVDYYSIQNGEVNATPTYRDSRLNVGTVNIGYNSIRYFPGSVEPNYMMVAGIDIEGIDAANVTTYLGSGQNIYASAENLYVAVTNYSRADSDSTYEESTQLYKFAMKDAKLTYLCKGTVPGTVLNQFSMDENGTMFRIATTKGNTWVTDRNISKNALYILDSMLSITGKIDDMAPGEKIYSVRFVGDRAYVVTFKTVDPLFVIDLKDPAKPSVLGALKIPGYSDYLHPYDENHIIGFGKDTVEIKGQAYYLGMKIALFDVTDVSNPIQMFTEMIGDRGTDSELLRNHKALLFSREKNLLAFPVTLMEQKNTSGNSAADQLQYGQFTFQGAFVYSLDLKTGFKLKGRITHLSGADYLKAGNSWYDSDKNVQRIIYIGDKLYTLSNGMIKANAITDLKEKGSIVIP
jgi:inhibitor of cysteine peptidase